MVYSYELEFLIILIDSWVCGWRFEIFSEKNISIGFFKFEFSFDNVKIGLYFVFVLDGLGKI